MTTPHLTTLRKVIICTQCGNPFNISGSQRSKKRKYCGVACFRLSQANEDRPSEEQLAQDIAAMSFLAIGKKYSISDNGVRLWARKYGLPTKKEAIVKWRRQRETAS